MCDDVPAFTDASVTLVIGIVKKFFMMIGFSGALLSLHIRALEENKRLLSVDVMLNTPLSFGAVASEMVHWQSACDVAFLWSTYCDMQLEKQAVQGCVWSVSLQMEGLRH